MEIFVVVMTILQLAAFVIFVRVVQKQVKGRPDADARVQRRETRLVELYDHVEELMDVFEAYIEEVRQGIEKDRSALTDMSRQAAAVYTRALEAAAAPPVPVREERTAPQPPQAPPDVPTAPAHATAPDRPGRSRLSARDREAVGQFATKPQKVRFLMSRGLALEEVARELGIGKGEVRLIAELEK